MVDQAAGVVANALHGHAEGLHRISRVEGRADAPTDDLLAVRVEDERQVAEAVAGPAIAHHDVGDVADPQLVGRRGDEVLDEVLVRREPVGGVRRARLPDAPAHLQAVLVDDAAEAVAADWVVAAELALVHEPQLHPADSRGLFANLHDVLQGELLAGRPRERRAVVVLVVCLLALAKQPAQVPDQEASGDLRVQVSYCLAPGFFRIGMLNRASARSIILS